jgi:hypothetical protein
MFRWGMVSCFVLLTFLQDARRISHCDLLLIAARALEGPSQNVIEVTPRDVCGCSPLSSCTVSKVKTVGLDTASLACVRHLDEGMDAHRRLLDGWDRRFSIIEDVNLDHDLSSVRAGEACI